MNKDIIRIAGAMGWRQSETGWRRPIADRPDYLHPTDENMPNPLESHDDCHALIEWLIDKGHSVNVWQAKEGCVVTIDATEWEHDDPKAYRKGVVELTLKILDESDE